ncbi:hypothetical protein HDU76_009517, partial [Blyttiomyces sp. JEL0837]
MAPATLAMVSFIDVGARLPIMFWVSVIQPVEILWKLYNHSFNYNLRDVPFFGIDFDTLLVVMSIETSQEFTVPVELALVTMVLAAYTVFERLLGKLQQSEIWKKSTAGCKKLISDSDQR